MVSVDVKHHVYLLSQSSGAKVEVDVLGSPSRIVLVVLLEGRGVKCLCASELCCKTCSLGTSSPPLSTSPGRKLHWLPISERIKYKVACMYELLHVYTPSRTLRSSSDTRMLEIQQYKLKIHGFRTFSCFGPRIWNSLPQDLRHCSTLSSFKAKLKTILFSQYFRPN